MAWPAAPIWIPLLVAALLALGGKHVPRRVADVIGIIAACLAICVALLRASAVHPVVYWLGGWAVNGHGFPVGIDLAIDPIAASVAMLASLLVMALAFSWHYFDSVGPIFHALLLVFLAAMIGLCFSGDVFNLFVWFELMTATAITLCGYKADETGPLVGAINFGVTNAVGAFMTLMGIALVYAWSGSLNFAGIAEALRIHPPPRTFLAVAMMLLFSGFLIKSAAFPFHFWLPDAHAVAPTPVCVLFSGVMVELGIYAIARMHYGMFAGQDGGLLRAERWLLVTIGSISAIVGAAECFLQCHLKRLLAFSTVSHAGLMLSAVGLLNHEALAGAMVYLLGHGLVKGALFLGAGILLHHFASVDEYDLRGKGKAHPWIGLMMCAGGLALTGLPPTGMQAGQSLIAHGADKASMHWLDAISLIAAILTGAAVLRMTGRVFLGWGDAKQPTRTLPRREKRETSGARGSTPKMMWIPMFLLLALSIAMVPAPHLRRAAMYCADRFAETGAYQQAVLGAPEFPAQTTNWPTTAPPENSWAHPFFATLGAIILALLALWPAASSRWVVSAAEWLRRGFRIFQSGKIGDYIAILVLGIAAGGAWLVLG